jgi:hypothetical protein
LLNGYVMKKGLRNVIGVHQVAPRLGIRLRLVGVPQRLPLLAGQLPPAALAVRSLEPERPRDNRMLVASSPRGVASASTLLPDLNRMQHHRRIQHHHVAEDMPRVRLADQRVVVPRIDGQPSVERARVVLPRKGKP